VIIKNLQLLPAVTCLVLHFFNANVFRTMKAFFAK